ncbi:ATP-binding protein [Amnibacterium kyonggiense]|uniref:Gluconate kinase n=1 Tax=Amnibacterium kyonggiense TaxID=595671 RepID=A0A4R7FRD3_9MICO|nr:ATP-binding protein [Amnibacterium kyonggiense]TDS80268.1 gluconate kinase [Amnibacterium kyonggiense]
MLTTTGADASPALKGVVRAIAAAASAARRPIVLVDGRSGAGKSTLAARLAPRLGADLVRLDDVYPGWDGLAAGAEHVRRHVLGTGSPRYRRWDWAEGRPGDWRVLRPGVPLVVEGSGALSRGAAPLVTFRVWLELDLEERRRRALDRDGDGYAPHWERWAEQEAAFVRRERPASLADAVVRSADWTVRFRSADQRMPLRAKPCTK